MFQAFLKHFWPSRCPTQGDGHQSGQLGANLAQLRTNLGPTWGQVRANFGQLRPTWTNFGPDAAATWPTSAQLGPQEPSGGLQKAFSDPPRQDFPLRGTIFAPFLHSCVQVPDRPVHKAVQTGGQHHEKALANSTCRISTATDSRSTWIEEY